MKGHGQPQIKTVAYDYAAEVRRGDTDYRDVYAVEQHMAIDY